MISFFLFYLAVELILQYITTTCEKRSFKVQYLASINIEMKCILSRAYSWNINIYSQIPGAIVRGLLVKVAGIALLASVQVHRASIEPQVPHCHLVLGEGKGSHAHANCFAPAQHVTAVDSQVLLPPSSEKLQTYYAEPWCCHWTQYGAFKVLTCRV